MRWQPHMRIMSFVWAVGLAPYDGAPQSTVGHLVVLVPKDGIEGSRAAALCGFRPRPRSWTQYAIATRQCARCAAIAARLERSTLPPVRTAEQLIAPP